MAESDQPLIAALDIGSSKVSALIVTRDPDGRLRVLGTGQRESRGVKRGYVTDMEASEVAVREAVEFVIDCERRALRREDHKPANGINDALVARQAGCCQLLWKLLVGREKELEWRAVLDLPRQRTRSAEHHLDA